MIKQFKKYVIWSCAVLALPLNAVYDNRFFYFTPEWHFSRTNCEQSVVAPYVSMITGNKAFRDEDKEVGMPEIFGTFDVQKLATAAVRAGITPTNVIVDAVNDGKLPAIAETIELLYHIDGKIEGQALNLFYEQKVMKHLSLGVAGSYMHIFSRHRFFPDEDLLKRLTSVADVRNLDQVRRELLEDIGVEPASWSAGGFSDINLYGRVGNVWDYVLKTKRIDAGLRFGVLIPSGVKRDPLNPASIPFGGNGHTGLYWQGDAEFELKEDLIVGLWCGYIDRLSKKVQDRLPIADEQPLYAAVLTDVTVNPGGTGFIAPYIHMNALRDGLGMHVRYAVVFHGKDSFRDVQTKKDLRFTLKEYRNHTAWTAERVTAQMFYDFAAVRPAGLFNPKVTFQWDIPVNFFGAERVAKTYFVSLGFSVMF